MPHSLNEGTSLNLTSWQRGLFQNIKWKVSTITPGATAVSLDDMKDHLRVRFGRDDALIVLATANAQREAEKQMNRSLTTQTLKLFIDRFPRDEIRLPRAPAISVTEIKYIDGDGVEQTWAPANFQVDVENEPARIRPAFGQDWPDTRLEMNAVTVLYQAGYGAAASVPPDIIGGIQLLTGHYYENREATLSGTIITTIPHSAQDAFNNNRVWEQ